MFHIGKFTNLPKFLKVDTDKEFRVGIKRVEVKKKSPVEMKCL